MGVQSPKNVETKSSAAMEPLLERLDELLDIGHELRQVAQDTFSEPIRHVAERLDAFVNGLQSDLAKNPNANLGSFVAEMADVAREAASALGMNVIVTSEVAQEVPVDQRLLERITPHFKAFLGQMLSVMESKRADDLGRFDPQRIKLSLVSKGDETCLNIESHNLPAFESFREAVLSLDNALQCLSGNLTHVSDGTQDVYKIAFAEATKILSAMIVQCRSDQFAIPSRYVVGVTAASPQAIGERRTNYHNQELPVLGVSEIVGLARGNSQVSPSAELVVVRAGGKLFALLVDSILDRQGTVMLPISKNNGNFAIRTGSSVVGERKSTLVLNLEALLSLLPERTISENDGIPVVTRSEAKFLLVQTSVTRRFAVPIELVRRIEDSNAMTVVEGGGRRCISYHNQQIEIFQLDKICGPSDRIIIDVGNSHFVLFLEHGGSQVAVPVRKVGELVSPTRKPDGSHVVDGKRVHVVQPEMLFAAESEETELKSAVPLEKPGTVIRRGDR